VSKAGIVGERAARRFGLAMAAFLLCVAGLIATPIGFAIGRPSPNAGTVPSMGPETVLADRFQWTADDEPRLRDPLDSAHDAVPDIDVHLATLAAQPRQVLGPRPIRVRVGSVGIDAPVLTVGVLPTGEMAVPEDVDHVGWYRFGARPGRAGSAVLSGHVDARLQGDGAFFRLQDVKPGDTVVVDFSDGSKRAFRVVARRAFPKEKLPASLFVRSGPPLLALITCGGAFDSRTRRYAENIVVYAVPG
jgi:hypothetical protein